MFAIASIVLAATGPAASSSAPVYLQCTTMQQGREMKMDVTLNEAQGMVDYNGAVSGPQRRPARFTATSVHFIGFELSRIDLSIKRPLTDLVGKPLGWETGSCKLVQPASRAF